MTIISQSADRLLPKAASLLCDLIELPTVSGSEEPAIERLSQEFEGGICKTEIHDIEESIKSDPDYAGLDLGLEYDGRHNLYVRAGSGEVNRRLILQTHVDVVPAGDWPDAFRPRVQGDAVFGRGACDCKGQAATLWLALAALEDAGIELRGRVCAQFVIEEEIGGNGALATILDGERADAAVILEPTGMNVHPACRGACWFRINIHGRSVHMGRKYEGVNAIEKAMSVIADLQAFETRLVEESLNQPLFERYDRPVQVNVGTIRAGDWPSMVPGECEIEGGVGFLPNKPMRVIQDELRQILAESEDPWIREHSRIDFPKLRNDAYAGDPNHPAVQCLASACLANGLPGDVFGWNVSCDARLYALRGGMPAIVFGPGDVKDAHSNHEQINLSDIAKAATVLAEFIVAWCG